MTRVLIVDDKEDNLYYLKVLLEGHGCAVTTAGHGAEALVKARQSPPDVVISDLLMPVMDGYTLLRHWKADPSLGRLPFIVYTATYTEQADEDLALDMGADAFIRKPAEPEEFLAELHKVRQTAVKRGGLGGDDKAVLESYSRLLIRKLEEKTLQLEEANRALQKDVTMRRETEESLRASQAGMVVAQSIAHLGSWEMRLTKPDGTRDHALSWSDEMYRIAGYEPGQVEISNEFFFQLVPPEDHELIRAAFRATVREGAPYSIVHSLIRADGQVRRIHAMAQVFRDEPSGRPVKMIGAAHDITERRLVEEKLQASEERFREMADNIGDIFYNYDPAGNQLLYANQAFERIWGRPLESVRANPLTYLDDVHPADREIAEQAFQRQLEGQQTEAEFRIVRADGRVLWIRELAVPILDKAGRVERIVGTMRDVTERKLVENRVAEQAALLDNAKDAILVRDLEHRILYWNRGAERLYGWTAAEAVGQPVKTLLYKESDSFLEATRTVLECGEWVGEIHQFDRNGKPLTIEGSWSLVRDEDGNPKSILAINTDISERKRLEQQILRVQRMESIGTLAGGMAHDLNNILAPILLSIDLLRIGEQDQRRLGILNAMESSTRRGSELVRQVLSFARGVEGRKMAVCPEKLLGEIEKIARETFPKNIQVESCVEPGLMSLTGDPTQLHQVLLNLCVNARDAMPAGGRITLSAYNKQVDERYAGLNPGAAIGPHVVLQVEDTGIGMEPATVERIFEPFFTTKEIGKGTGLGLSTTQAIVKSHGGFARVDSQPGEGTRFRVFLPSQPGKGKTGGAEKETALQRGAGELILVIEDETDVRELVRDTLEAYGYKVLLAGDGAAGVKLFQEQQDAVSVVLTDMMMPGMDGRGVIQAIRSLQPQARIIAASGLTDGSAAAKAGVSHFIPKPFSARTLLEAVSLVLTEA